MKIAELFENKSFAPYFVMDISHEPNDEIQVHVLNTDQENNEDYHVQVIVDEKTWEVVSISGYDSKSTADVKKDSDKIVASVNDEFKKHSDLKQVKKTDKTKIG